MQTSFFLVWFSLFNLQHVYKLWVICNLFQPRLKILNEESFRHMTSKRVTRSRCSNAHLRFTALELQNAVVQHSFPWRIVTEPASSGANLCWALGGMICNFTPIFPYFQHWGDEPRPRLFSGELIKWRPKKKSSPEMEHFFSPISSSDLRSDAHQSQTIGGDADEDNSQIVGGIESNYWGGYIPLFPPCFSTPASKP